MSWQGCAPKARSVALAEAWSVALLRAGIAQGLSITHSALRAAPRSTRRRLPCGLPAAPYPYTRVSHLSLCLYRAGSAHTSEQAVSAVGCRSTGLRWSPLALGRNALRNRGCAYFLFPPTHPVSSRRSFGLRSSLVQKIEGVFRRWSCGEPRRARELHKGRASARATPRTAVQFTSPASCPSALKAIN